MNNMIWAVNSDGIRVQARSVVNSNQIQMILKSPCCSQPVFLVRPSDKNRIAYFRHRPHSACPFANCEEYNNGLHWEIISFIIALSTQKNLWRKILWRSLGLSFIGKISLRYPREYKQEAIIYDSTNTIAKRIDLVINKQAIEIQCSSISNDEIHLRERIYMENGYRIVWVLGLSDRFESVVSCELPYEASAAINAKNSVKIKKERHWITQTSRFSVIIRGIKLSKWQYHLLLTENIFGVYFHKILYPKFKIISLYTHVPKIQFEGASKKQHFLILPFHEE